MSDPLSNAPIERVRIGVAPHDTGGLGFARDALAPAISGETIDFHFGKHHQAYVDKLNELIKGTPHEPKSLEEIIRESTGVLFNQAAQHFNHAFYWSNLHPGGTALGDPLAAALKETFGTVEDFQRAFTEKAAAHFGSGWCWLVKNAVGHLEIETTHDAGCPISTGHTPLLTCDLWEHAYYIDYRNDRKRYLESFWKIVNWPFVTMLFEKRGHRRAGAS